MIARSDSPALISAAELAALLDTQAIVLLDATFTLPGVSPNAGELYAERHIPGARFFDINAVADEHTSLPHMLPTAAVFADHAGALGISNDTTVIVYDTPGMMSAGRAWWTFRVMGHDKVRILDGGLRSWQAEGLPVTGEVPPAPRRVLFKAVPRRSLLRTRADLLANLARHAEQVIDARSVDRFLAKVPEPRPGLRAGHIPGSLNLPFDRLSDPGSGRMKSPDALASLFAEAGIREDRPVVATCGSGVTAGALCFALHLIGREDVALYDGSWAEWGMPGDTPVAS